MYRKVEIEEEGLPVLETSLGRFRATGLLNETRTSKVYVGEVDGEEIVVKVLRAALARQELHRDRIAREARIGSRLRHGAYARVLDSRVEPALCFIALERLETMSLAQVMARLTPSTAPRWQIWCSIIAAAARGVSALHQLIHPNSAPEGWIHGDMSPGNLHLTGEGEVKVLDLGLVRPAGQRGRGLEAEVVSGTTAYLAPERATGGSVGVAADLFALGVILYEATTLQHLLARDTEAETLAAVRGYRMARPPHLCVEGYPRGLEAAVIRALRRAPAERFPSAMAMASELERLVSDSWDSGRQREELEGWVAKLWGDVR